MPGVSAEAAALLLYEQECVEFQRRMVEHGLAPHRRQRRLDLLFPLRRSVLCRPLFLIQLVELFQELRSLGIPRSERFDIIDDRQPQRRDVHAVGRKEDPATPGLDPVEIHFPPDRLPTLRKSHRRLQPQVVHSRGQSRAGEFQRVLALGGLYFAGLFPLDTVETPGVSGKIVLGVAVHIRGRIARDASAGLAEALVVNPDLHRPFLRRPVTDVKCVSRVDREIDVVFDHPRQLTSVADHQLGKLVTIIGVDVRVGEDLGITTIEGPGGNLERTGRFGLLFGLGPLRQQHDAADKARRGEYCQRQPARP